MAAGADLRDHRHFGGDAAGDGRCLYPGRRRRVVSVDRGSSREPGNARILDSRSHQCDHRKSRSSRRHTGWLRVHQGLPKARAQERHTMRDHVSRIGQLPSVVDTFPAGLMADEILTPGEGQVRALVCLSGNPLLDGPQQQRAPGRSAQGSRVARRHRHLPATKPRTTRTISFRAPAPFSARTCPLCFSR